jgi:GT2 family glycosyltransferase
MWLRAVEAESPELVVVNWPHRAMSPVSVVIPTYRRCRELGVAIRKIIDCRPPPSEIIVHVDAGDVETEPWLRREFPTVQVLQSAHRVGPGGGRNTLVGAALSDIVASFDDDSYPLDPDYFARLSEVFSRRPDAAVVASQIVHRGEPAPNAAATVGASTLFVGCGVAYRRRDFLECGGYVPLAVAYGMEEVDLAIRLTSRGKHIYFSPWLRVFHDMDFSRHRNASITAASIANLALLTYLRYPVRYWPYGFMQVVNRVCWLLTVRRFPGIVTGLLRIPAHIWSHRRYRETVSSSGLAAFLRARRTPTLLEPLGNDREPGE